MLLFLVSARCLCIMSPFSLIYSLVEGKKKGLITCREWQEYIYFNNSLFSVPGICLHLKIGWSSPQGWEGAARQPACSRLLLAQGWLPRHCKQSSGAAQSLYFPKHLPRSQMLSVDLHLDRAITHHLSALQPYSCVLGPPSVR